MSTTTSPSLNAPASDTAGAVALRIMEEIGRAASIPGMSVAVAGPGRQHFAGAVGYADMAEQRRSTTSDQHPWFSMTKIATATTVMRLHADGVLDVDRPIGSYLPGYRPHPERGHPTTRQLLGHTAGLRNPVPVRWVRPEAQPPDPAALRRIGEKHGTPRRRVGVRATYSNIGYLLAADVVLAATGRALEEWVHEVVLTPLGMTGTAFRFDPGSPRAVGYVRAPRALHPLLRAVLPAGIVGPRTGRYTSFNPFLVNGAAYGGLVGTAADAARLAATHVAASDDPHPVLSHHHIETMRTISSAGKPFDHGIGWFRKPADATRTPAFVEHYGTGGGFWNAMRIYPGSRLAMVAMTNTTSAWDVDQLFGRLEALPWA